MLRALRNVACSQALHVHSATVTRFPTRAFSAAAVMASQGAKPSTKKEQRTLRANIRMEGIDHSVLDSYTEYLRRTATEMGIVCTGRIPLPTKREIITVLKSPHVSKKHRQQFARITHHRLLQVFNASDLTLNTYLKFVENNCPEGVIVKLTEYHSKQLQAATA